MNDERRHMRKEMRLVRNESSWLQKALFALGKAEDAHGKLADFRGEASGDYTFPLQGEEVSVEEMEDAIQSRLDGLQEKVRERRQRLR